MVVPGNADVGPNAAKADRPFGSTMFRLGWSQPTFLERSSKYLYLPLLYTYPVNPWSSGCLLKSRATSIDQVGRRPISPVSARIACLTTHMSKCSRRIMAPSAKYARVHSRSFAGRPIVLRVRREQTYVLPAHALKTVVSAVCWICHSACPSLSEMRR